MAADDGAEWVCVRASSATGPRTGWFDSPRPKSPPASPEAGLTPQPSPEVQQWLPSPTAVQCQCGEHEAICEPSVIAGVKLRLELQHRAAEEAAQVQNNNNNCSLRDGTELCLPSML